MIYTLPTTQMMDQSNYLSLKHKKVKMLYVLWLRAFPGVALKVFSTLEAKSKKWKKSSLYKDRFKGKQISSILIFVNVV